MDSTISFGEHSLLFSDYQYLVVMGLFHVYFNMINCFENEIDYSSWENQGSFKRRYCIFNERLPGEQKYNFDYDVGKRCILIDRNPVGLTQVIFCDGKETKVYMKRGVKIENDFSENTVSFSPKIIADIESQLALSSLILEGEKELCQALRILRF